MKLGVLGIGLMGDPIAHRLMHCGYAVTVFNRTAAKTQSLESAGATIASTVAQLIQQSEAILLTLTDAEAIESLLFAPESCPDLTGKTIIQMGTIAPEESQFILKQVQKNGGNYLEAPVLGSIPEAKVGALLVMVGSTIEQFETWRSLFQSLGEAPRHIGPVGTAAALKLSLNQLIGALTTAFATSLAFSQRYSVPTEILMEILRDSALYAPTFDKKLKRMEEQNFANPNFPTKHLLKDMRLFESAADSVQVNTTVTAAICALIQNAMGDFADQDYSALSSVVSRSLQR